MKRLVSGFLLCGALASLHAGSSNPSMENANLAWQGRWADGQLKPMVVTDKINGGTLALSGGCFEVVLGDGTTVRSADYVLREPPRVEPLPADPTSSVAGRHFAGQQLVARFADDKDHLTAEWRVILEDGATYLRSQLTLRAIGGDVLVKEIVLFDQSLPGAAVVGSVDGSPIVAGNFFLGYEHPMAQNAFTDGVARCALRRNAVLRDGESLVQGCVVGVAPAGQMRRGFLAYLERERAHPYRPFLHYNSWFDIAWDNRKFNEAESLEAINRLGEELVQKRGVKLQSFLFDDGWDDDRTLWNFHSGFPNGFTGLRAAAARFDASVGVWLSPFGGYNAARERRLEYGIQQGFETNASGFSLAGPKYYQRFHDICLDMVKRYDVNMFKFDGLAAGAKASETGQTRDGDAMLRLVADLRSAKPEIYINETTGTWPSPFWLLYVDSTWRGGADHDFSGQGTPRQQWVTYRDAQTYANVVQRGPLYPLNSLMLHGIVLAKNAARLETAVDAEFADEVQSYFATGTQLQELYLTPKLLNPQNWDDLAAAANWSRAHADVLVDTHWVGGDPGNGQVYGWASWAPGKAVLALRNPGDQPATFAAAAQTVFQLPAGVSKPLDLVRVTRNGKPGAAIQLPSAEKHVFTLQPFEVAVWETAPAADLPPGAGGRAAMSDRHN